MEENTRHLSYCADLESILLARRIRERIAARRRDDDTECLFAAVVLAVAVWLLLAVSN